MAMQEPSTQEPSTLAQPTEAPMEGMATQARRETVVGSMPVHLMLAVTAHQACA